MVPEKMELDFLPKAEVQADLNAFVQQTMSKIKLTKRQEDMLYECARTRNGFDWGDVQCSFCDSAKIGSGLAWHNFVRTGEALLDKGLITTGPSEPHGDLTDLGRAWIAWQDEKGS